MSAMNFMAGLKAEANSTSVRFSKLPQFTREEHIVLPGIYSCLD